VLGEAIADQEVFLLAWSQNASSSHFIELEWTTALALKKTIIPCLMDSTSLHPSLAATHAIPIDNLSQVIAALTGTPISQHTERRDEVIRKLNGISATDELTVLQQAKDVFVQQQWIVLGNVYQAVRDIHIHPGLSREPVLRGRLFLVEDNDALTPASDVTVTLLQTRGKTDTDEDGLFNLALPASFQPGIKVQLTVKKNEWVIYSPLDGEITIPALDTDLVEIRLVKKGSKKLCSAESIEKFIQEMAGKSTEQIRPEGKPQEIDFSRYIQDWAERYGFSPQRVKAEIDMWVTEAEQQNDPHQLGLAAYAKKNFGEAGKLFEESAAGKARRAHEAAAEAQHLTDEAIRDYRLAGDAHMNNYQFEQALIAYESARMLTSRNDQPRLWSDLTVLIGNSEANIGIRTKGEGIRHHLGNAVTAYREALTIYTKDQLPQDWIDTSCNLAEALFLSSQFAKTSDHLAMLLDYPDLGPSAGVALLAIAIANSVALGNVERTEEELEKTSSLLSRQDSDFFLTWDFSSINTFIDKNPVFGNHRQWLLHLIETFQSTRRDEMRAAVRTARDAFRKATKP
jgi:tetratricopeptide (TPR) repeat protein